MNHGVEYYRAWGQPATATVKVIALPAIGKTVTVDGNVYVYGTDFVSSGEDKTPKTLTEIAKSLAAAINSDKALFGALSPTQTQTIRRVYAIYYGQTVRIMATAPGSSQNSITLSTNDSGSFVVSGGTLTGGTDGPTVTTQPSTSTGSFIPGQLNPTVVTPGTPVKLDASTHFRSATLLGQLSPRVNNTGNVYIGPSIGTPAGSSLPITITPGSVWELDAAPGFDELFQYWWLDAVNANDGLVIVYR